MCAFPWCQCQCAQDNKTPSTDAEDVIKLMKLAVSTLRQDEYASSTCVQTLTCFFLSVKQVVSERVESTGLSLMQLIARLCAKRLDEVPAQMERLKAGDSLVRSLNFGGVFIAYDLDHLSKKFDMNGLLDELALLEKAMSSLVTLAIELEKVAAEFKSQDAAAEMDKTKLARLATAYGKVERLAASVPERFAWTSKVRSDLAKFRNNFSIKAQAAPLMAKCLADFKAVPAKLPHTSSVM